MRLIHMKGKRPVKHLLAALLLTSLPLAPALAHGPIAAKPAAAEAAKFNADRAAILAMAGTYKVRFDFTETTPWVTDYSPVPPKPSGGHEVVRVIEDTGRRIVLQHILVHEADGPDGQKKAFVTKHWRQDWEYEPASVLVYKEPGRWVLEDVPERMRKGRWSQTVWQTDDSPRYGGWGEFSDEGGITRWRSNWTWRPLPRRDAVRKPVYDRFMAINRHQWTPTGWIHWQDNTKMAPRDGKLTAIVQEQGLNSYTRFDGFNAARADAYWAKTSGYWAEVRKAWDAVMARDKGIAVAEQADWGSVTSERLMTMADKVEAGEMTEAAASAEARRIILAETQVRTASR
jgi:hypothetical protein